MLPTGRFASPTVTTVQQDLVNDAVANAQANGGLQTTTAAMTLYVNGNTGSDVTGDGTAALPYETIQRAMQDVPPLLSHSVVIRLVEASSYKVDRIRVRFADGDNTSRFIVDGVDAISVVAAGPYSGTVAATEAFLTQEIDVAGGGLVADAWKGKYLHILDGASIDRIVPVIRNSATKVWVLGGALNLGAGSNFRVVEPGAQIEALNDEYGIEVDPDNADWSRVLFFGCKFTGYGAINNSFLSTALCEIDASRFAIRNSNINSIYVDGGWTGLSGGFNTKLGQVDYMSLVITANTDQMQSHLGMIVVDGVLQQEGPILVNGFAITAAGSMVAYTYASGDNAPITGSAARGTFHGGLFNIGNAIMTLNALHAYVRIGAGSYPISAWNSRIDVSSYTADAGAGAVEGFAMLVGRGSVVVEEKASVTAAGAVGDFTFSGVPGAVAWPAADAGANDGPLGAFVVGY